MPTRPPNAFVKVSDRRAPSVSPLELILDVVFVLAISECTGLMAEDPSWSGLVAGLLVLTILWRGWVGFAWLTSAVDPDGTFVRLAVFTAMGAIAAMALSIEESFGRLGYVFAGAYAVIRGIHYLLGRLASEGDPAFRSTVQRNAIGGIVAVGFLLAAAVVDGNAMTACWIGAIVADFGIGAFHIRTGWKLVPGHFAERHSLIVIIALGESVLAVGVGATQVSSDALNAHFQTVGLAFVAVMLVALLWWAYFDGVADAAEHRLEAMPAGFEQNEIARLAYSLLHLPLIGGVILAALGLKFTIGHPHDALSGPIAAAFFGGVGLYLLAHVAFRRVMLGDVNWARLVTGLMLFALIPAGPQVDAWISQFVITALMAMVIVLESRTRPSAAIRQAAADS